MDPAKFKLKIDSIFQKMELNNNLIIDLRFNTGGKIENEYYLLSYLISTEIKAPFKRVYKNSKNKKIHYKTKKIHEKSENYNGSIYFIMNGYTFSAAAEFLSIVQRYELGKLVGEETGGASEGCNYGAKEITLPYSKITCSVPCQASYFNASGICLPLCRFYHVSKQRICLQAKCIRNRLHKQKLFYFKKQAEISRG